MKRFACSWMYAVIYLLMLDAVFSYSIIKNLMMEKEKNNDDINIPFVDYDADPGRVQPPDHLKAVKIERDGDKNQNYHKEVFLGVEAEKFRNGDYKLQEQKQKLTDIFNAVDLNHDGSLDEGELTLWVLTKTREHFYEARMNNQLMFKKLDGDGDERVTWNEFLSYFLSEKGFDRGAVFKQLEGGEKVEVPVVLDEIIQDLREKWIQVQDVGKKSLTAEQFLDFEHPETSKAMLAFLVEDILHDMDTDDSKDITLQEYVAMAPEANVDSSNDVWVVERSKEFRNVIDGDKDGKVTTEELQAYLDPLSRSSASGEARQLIGFGDTNEDGLLTLQEVLENAEFYTGSKLYNYAESVHEEF